MKKIYYNRIHLNALWKQLSGTVIRHDKYLPESDG